MVDDAELILSYLEQRGKMRLTDKSSPEEIKQVFNMSKKLLKEHLEIYTKIKKLILLTVKPS